MNAGATCDGGGWWPVYAEGPEPVTPLDRERAAVLAANGVARGGLAGVLLGFDRVTLDGRPTRRGDVTPEHVVEIEGIRCADAWQTLVDLAAYLDDDTWEQVLESALRMRMVTVEALAAVGPRVPGCKRIRRVLARRPDGAPPTESLLETLMVQLARTVPGLPEPVRQQLVTTVDGAFVARVDLCWPDLGLFLELDGQHHENQPVHDAARQTAVIAATGWLVGRFTWREVTRSPKATARRLAALVDQARLHAAGGDRYPTPSRSTTNTRVSPPLMTPPAPWSP